MADLFDSEPKASDAVETLSGRILIVDDDPVAAGMLGVSLGAAGHEIVEANSGEEALTRLADSANGTLPDIVFLDIEMGMGIDGYEACRRLRATDATRQIPVIFLSGHDELDDRLRAYDAGGSDFMAKPFVPAEVLRKAEMAIRHKRRQEKLATEGQSSFGAAMTALTTLGESGVTLKFSRDALGCHTLSALATLVIESIRSFGIDCHVQLRTPSQTLTLTPRGAASPLEESVIEKTRSMERIFSFKNRMIVNFDSVSLLVLNMPVDDGDLCGRIRDHAAMIAEAAELAADNINLRTEAVSRSFILRQLADASRQTVEELRGNYRELQVATRHELETMTHNIEGLYVHLGLSNQQEFAISDTVRGAVENVLILLESSSKLDQNFAGIVSELTKASEYTVAQNEEAVPSIELW